MKYKTITLTLVAASLFAGEAFAQISNEMTRAQRDKKDSVEIATHYAEQVQDRRK